MKKAITAIAAAAALFTAAIAADAHDYKVGNLEIVHPVARATPPGAPVSGGYMTIRNTGSETDRLVGGSADFAGKVEIHEMAMEGDVMKMRQLEDGLEIPAGGEVVLKPGGYHVMFMQMKEQLKPDTGRKAVLVFEKAGEVEVEFSVVTPDKLKMDMH
ncbi:copper chaperone PCu(A)C [Oricola thermophila]|uniref:Copper chaperone PCu(A)C n=1 Tax=Oricola thermophila TaxID=2742145 RepID=A0A6N1VIW1_9HYPH|nr:copper chaperone PCu(A)C [Oricola thermophila]QKV19302.1 copper chaperone PCu(A)C [Oricola thermophila]